MAPAHESETIVFNFRKLLSTLPNYAELEQILLFSVNWGKQVCIRNGCILMHTGGSRGCFDNLVKFVYELDKNWQTRAWDPVFKTAGSAPDAAMILGLFSQKNLKINIDRKLY